MSRGSGKYDLDLRGVTLMDRFEVEEKLDQGGMGAVYKARDLNLGTAVIIKVPHVQLMSEPNFSARFAREVDELIRLRHMNVVRVLARGEYEAVPFFVLEYLQGGSLAEKLRVLPDRRQALPEVLAWLKPIAGALDYVNEMGVIHRDVKPANILFDEHGNPYLADFGVAKILAGETSALTRTGMALGSPSFMSPEQALGRDVTSLADQYALAATAYAALSGVPPFDRGTQMEVLLKKQHEDPAPLARLVPDLPEPAVAAIMRGLSRKSEDRFFTCEAFVEAVEAKASLPGRPRVDAQRTVSAGWSNKFCRTWSRARKRGVWLAALGVVLAFVAGLAYLGSGHDDGSTQGKASAPAGGPWEAPLAAAKAAAARKEWVAAERNLNEALSMGAPGMAIPAALERGIAAWKRVEQVPTWAMVSEEQKREAKKLGVSVAFENKMGMRFVLIPAGTFLMGSPESEESHFKDEKEHVVTLSKAYYLQITEVTNAQYRRFKRSHDSGSLVAGGLKYLLNADEQPVLLVSWEEAQAFLTFLNRQESGAAYRLPTEAEWERAARAGTSTRFSFGDRYEDLIHFGNFADRRTNFRSRENALDDGHASTTHVGSYRASPWGLFDMHGNVWEWVQDWYQEAYPPGRSRDPTGPSAGKNRVTRGGSWFNTARFSRSASRNRHPPMGFDNAIGFRVARSVVP